MKDYQVSATVPKNEEKGIKQDMNAVITVKFPENFEEAKKMNLEEAIMTNAFANWRVTLQSNIRSSLKRGDNESAIQTRLGSAVIGVAQQGVKVDPVQAYLAKFQSATPEEQAKMLNELKKRAAK